MKTNKILESGIFWGIVVGMMIMLYILSIEIFKWVAAGCGIFGLIYYFKVILPDVTKRIMKEEEE